MTGQMRARYLICYDISDDHKRQKLSEMLLDYGGRLQMSVFEAELSEEDVKDIFDRAKNYVAEEDSMRVYSICENCLAKIRTLGRDFTLDTDGARIL